MNTLADCLLPDALWQRIQPLLPPPPSHARGGAPRTVSDRACMAAIVFMARTSTPWALLPVGEFGCGSVTTCWRRFAEWAHAGVFERLHELLLDELGAAGRLDWSRISVDSFSLRATRGDHTGANPVDRAKSGSKLHLANEGGGLPLSLLVTAANTLEAAVFEALLDDIPKVRTPAGGRRCRPDKCHADKAYDNRHCRSYLTRRGIKVRIARRGVESSTRLGRHRWKAERTIAWLAGCRRLRIRYDRDSERFFAFAMLGCARLCYNRWVSTVSGPQQPHSPHIWSLPRSPPRIAAPAIAMPNDSAYMHAVHVLDDPSELPQRVRWYLSQWGSRFRTPLSAAKIRGAVSVTADLGMPDPGPVPEQLLAQMIAFEQRYGGLAARLPPSGDFAEFGLDATGDLEAWRDAASGWVVDCGCDHRGIVWVLDEDGLVQTRGALGLQGDRGTMPAHLELLALQVIYVMNPQWTRVWVEEPPDDTVLDRWGSWPDAPAAVLERLGSLPAASVIELPGGTTWWADEQVAACWYPLRERAVLYGHGPTGVRRIEQAIKGAGS